MPRHVFTARELEVYGEECLRVVVSRISDLHNGLKRNAQPFSQGQPPGVIANLTPQPSTANQTQTFTENQIATHPPLQPQPSTSTVDQSTTKISTMKPSDSFARAAFTPQDARSDLFKISSRNMVLFTVATSDHDYAGLIRLWIGNLPDSFTIDDLIELIQEWQSSISTISEPQPSYGFNDTGRRHSSFGVRNPQDADLIMKSLDGRCLTARQRPLLVRPYQSMAQRAFKESPRTQRQHHQRVGSMALQVRHQVSMETPHGLTYHKSANGQKDTSGQKPRDQDPNRQITPGTRKDGSNIDCSTLKSYSASDNTREQKGAFSPPSNEPLQALRGIGRSHVPSENVRPEGLGDPHRSDHVNVDSTQRSSDHDMMQADLEKRREEDHGSHSIGLEKINLSYSIDRSFETPTQNPPKVQLPQHRSPIAEPDQRLHTRTTNPEVPPKCSPKAAKAPAPAAKQKVPIPLASMHFPSTGRAASGAHKAAASSLARALDENVQSPKLETAADNLEKAQAGPGNDYSAPQQHLVESSQ